MDEKRALTLCGGGAKGAYEIGAIRALYELGEKFDIITGTSIGALTGAMLVQGDAEQLNRLWEGLSIRSVMTEGFAFDGSLETLFRNKGDIVPFLKSYVNKKGADIEPFRKIIRDYGDEARFFASPIDFALIAVRFPAFTPVEMTKSRMPRGQYKDWLLASASAFPAFPLCRIGGGAYIDGGYYDNLPIDSAFRLGASTVVAVDLNPEPTHPHHAVNPLVRYIRPYRPLGSFLLFEHEPIMRNISLGYQDTMKSYGRLFGFRYAFRPDADTAR